MYYHGTLQVSAWNSCNCSYAGRVGIGRWCTCVCDFCVYNANVGIVQTSLNRGKIVNPKHVQGAHYTWKVTYFSKDSLYYTCSLMALSWFHWSQKIFLLAIVPLHAGSQSYLPSPTM